MTGVCLASRLCGALAALAVGLATATAQPLLSPPPPPGTTAPAEAESTRSPPRVSPASAEAVVESPVLPPPAMPELSPPAILPPMESLGQPYCPPDGGVSPAEFDAPQERHWLYNHLKLRHSSSHGRAMGPGGPLRGTSWLNRPYEVAYEFGLFLMTDGPAANVRSGNDAFNALQIGLDFDHYWGAQLRLGVTSPRLLNTTQIGAGDPEESLSVSDLSVLYYPWGDARARPYYRVGAGLTNIEFVNDFGLQVEEQLLTIPFGVGIKYQLKKAFVLRLELMNNLAFGQNETDTLNNVTLTSGFEWRFGNGTKHRGGWTPLHHSW